MFTIQGYIPSTRGPDLSFSSWRRCYEIPWVVPRVSCLGQIKAVQFPRPGQKLATKVSKFRAIPPYVSGVSPRPGWPLISALVSLRLLVVSFHFYVRVTLYKLLLLYCSLNLSIITRTMTCSSSFRTSDRIFPTIFPG